MMLALPRATEVLGTELPMYGSESAAYAMTAALQSVIDDIRGMRHLVTLALADLGMLQGAGLGALMRFLTEQLMTGGARVGDDVETASQAFSRFGRTCDTLNDRARSALRECDARLAEIGEAWQEMQWAGHQHGPNALAALPVHWHASPALEPPAEALCQFDTADLMQSRSSWGAGARQWHRALNDIATLREHWDQLMSERREAEHQLAATLDASMLVTTVSRASKARSARAQLARAITGLEASRPGAHEHPALVALIAGELSPDEAAEAWKRSSYVHLTPDELRSLPLGVLVGLAGTVGIPAHVQDVVARATLEAALADPRTVYREMGFAGSRLSLAHFDDEVRSVENALAAADADARDLPTHPPIQLLGFGNHADALTATLVVGDLDTATHVGVNVSGMFSRSGTMDETFPGVTQLFAHATQEAEAESFAVAHWLGYRSPGMLPGESGVLNLQRAQAGGHELGRFLDGALASRDAPHTALPKHTVVFGHSYGSTTAVEAIKMMSSPVDHLVTYGSAGVDLRHLDSLSSSAVSATSARGDQVAWLGILGSGRIDPRDIEGVNVFSSESIDGRRRVTVHDMYADEDERSLLNPTKTGYLSPETHSLWHMSNILAGKTPTP